MLINREIQLAAQALGDLLHQRSATVTTAESCTGGAIAAAITAIAGSSSWLEVGLVTYSNRFKQQLLSVSEHTIAQHGVVSEPVVAQMLAGVCALAVADYGIAVSGIAGPGGATAHKPVGTVCFAWGAPGYQVQTTQCFQGDRDTVREQAVLFALSGLSQFLKSTG